MHAKPDAGFSGYDPLNPVVRRNPCPRHVHLRQHQPVKYLPGMNAYPISGTRMSGS